MKARILLSQVRELEIGFKGFLITAGKASDLIMKLFFTIKTNFKGEIAWVEPEKFFGFPEDCFRCETIGDNGDMGKVF